MSGVLFATLVLTSAMGPQRGASMVRVSQYLSMEDCEAAAKGLRAFSGGRDIAGEVVIAACVPSFVDDDDNKR